jgi:hypothetical protein
VVTVVTPGALLAQQSALVLQGMLSFAEGQDPRGSYLEEFLRSERHRAGSSLSKKGLHLVAECGIELSRQDKPEWSKDYGYLVKLYCGDEERKMIDGIPDFSDPGCIVSSTETHELVYSSYSSQGSMRICVFRERNGIDIIPTRVAVGGSVLVGTEGIQSEEDYLSKIDKVLASDVPGDTGLVILSTPSTVLSPEGMRVLHDTLNNFAVANQVIIFDWVSLNRYCGSIPA